MALDLSHNRLSGDAPPEIGNLSNLKLIRVRGNRMTGCLLIGPQTTHDIDDSANLTICTGREALVALYHATNGPGWVNNMNWLSDEPLRYWYGVWTDRAGRVAGLRLARNGLSGQLPPELSGLHSVDRMFLYDNRLGGELPPELGELPDLRRLFVGGNRFAGCAPGALADISDSDVSTLGLPFCASDAAGPPSSPALSAFSHSPTQVSLTWSHHNMGASISQQLRRDGALVATLPEESRSYTDDSLSPEYPFRIRVDRSDGRRLWGISLGHGRIAGISSQGTCLHEPVRERVRTGHTGRPEPARNRIPGGADIIRRGNRHL